MRLLSSLLLLLLGVGAAHALIQLDPETRQFIRVESGSTQIFHGVNAVFKTAPYLPCFDCPFDPLLSFNQHDIDFLVEHGFNAVRLGVMWVAVEPERGVYNYTFLREARRLVDALGEAGIVTMIDMHQDLLSPSTCGEGIPDWAAELAITQRDCTQSWIAEVMHSIGVCKSITEFGMRFDEKGNPLTEDCLKHPFPMFYATPEVSSMFQSLFDNRAGLRESFVNYWRTVAAFFADSEHVLGYDLINEPMMGFWEEGTVWDILLPGRNDRDNLQPLYSELTRAIRQVDPAHLIFFEPTPLPDSLPLFGGLVFPVGFNNTPGSGDGRDVLSWHYYCCLSDPDGCDDDGNPTDEARCDEFASRTFNQRLEDLKSLKVGGFLSEFGACTTGPSCVNEIERTTRAADEGFQSWAYWQYKYFNDVTTTGGPMEGAYNPATGEPFWDKLRALARSYAQVVQGQPQSMRFDPQTGRFELRYTTTPQARQPTDIFVSERFYYPRGPQVTVEPKEHVSVQLKHNHVIVSHASSMPEGATVVVTITA